jgi:hypothetical protein
MAFDIEGARQAGYSDGEIAQFLGSQSGFDVDGAIKSGYDPSEVVSFLSGAGDDQVPDTSDPLTRITPSVSSSNPTLTVSPMAEAGQRSVLEKQPARPDEFDFRKATAARVELDDQRNKAPSVKAGVPGKADPNVARGADLADSSLPVRAAAKAATGLAQGVGGVVRAAGDLAGLDSVAKFGAAAGKGARAFEEGMGQSGPIEGFGPKSPLPYLKDMAEGATSSLGQSALFAAAFGPAGVIPAMSIQSAGQEYDQARELFRRAHSRRLARSSPGWTEWPARWELCCNTASLIKPSARQGKSCSKRACVRFRAKLSPIWGRPAPT